MTLGKIKHPKLYNTQINIDDSSFMDQLQSIQECVQSNDTMEELLPEDNQNNEIDSQFNLDFLTRNFDEKSQNMPNYEKLKSFVAGSINSDVDENSQLYTIFYPNLLYPFINVVHNY